MVKYKYIYIIVLICIISTIGCGNVVDDDALPEHPTFATDIAPILQKNCLPCHRENGAAPFSLASYEAVKKRAKTIAKVTANRIMPPWPADPTYTHFVGERVLTDQQIALIQRWYEQGAVEGSSEYAYEAPNKYRSSIGKPDLVIPFSPIDLKEGDADRFFISKTHVHLEKGQYISALEFVPSKFGFVHHVNGHFLLYADGTKNKPQRSSAMIEVKEGVGADAFQTLELGGNTGAMPFRIHSAFNYLPGVEGVQYPPGIGGFEVTKDFAAVMNDVHYGPSDANYTDQSVLNVFFSDRKPDRPTAELMLGTNGVSKIVPKLLIPANQKTKHVSRYTIAEDISVLTINPHLHQLGKSFWAFAIKPNGDTIPLIRILRWDFNWQYFYTFKQMLRIPAGSEIVAIAEFDNTSSNPNNPNNPPVAVGERWDYGGASMRASDEMFQFIVTYTKYKKGDENISLEPRRLDPQNN
jgi:hypothetical protein